MYLDYVLLRPDDGCFTAETCCLEVIYKILLNFLLLYIVFLDGNKYHLLVIPENMCEYYGKLFTIKVSVCVSV
jgi:hypothetical protein